MQYNKDAMQEAMDLANTPEGQQLLKLLRQQNGDALQEAAASAAAGDFTRAQNAISALLENPEAKALLSRLGGYHE